MKLLLLSKTSQLIGGVETYLRDLIPVLKGEGIELAVQTEDGKVSPSWYGDTPYLESFEAVEAWKPDRLYVHGLNSPELEQKLISRWPAVFFAHNYDSTCISGLKRWERPTLVPCEKVLGAACLAHYFVNGCGGKNPVSMLRHYANRVAHRRNLALYRSVLTHSVWMQQEYGRHLPTGAVHRIPFLVTVNTKTVGHAPESVWRIGFLGRFQTAKGGGVLIEAARHLSDLSRPVEIWLMGEGPQAGEWEAQAEKVSSPRISFRFLSFSADPSEFLSQIHLLALPSRWPEPFGRVGVEAAAKGVPSVAFALGGVQDWLQPLKTGVLVPLTKEPALSFSDGLRTALESADLNALRANAVQSISRFSAENHLRALLPHLSNAR